ncbi:MAG: FAD-binding oxidoreductase [Flavobacteriales bacterium]|nr:FAD-binding oxidoreductase [Flavobacteriales bacterium]
MHSRTMLNVEKLSYWERKTFFDKIDFLIIGAGIVGYSTAINLRALHPNSKIVIIERGYLPSGASSKNAGFACFGSATELMDDLESMPEKKVWDTVELRWKGLMQLRELIGDDNLKLQINGSWDLISNDQDPLFLKTKENLPYLNAQIEKITGEKDVYSIESNIKSKFGFNKIKTSIKNRLEGQIDTASMNEAFYKKAVNASIHMLFGIEAEEINNQAGNIIISTSSGEIKAAKVALCTNGFSKRFLPNEDILPARAQVLITKPIKGLKLEGTFHFEQGYYYFRNIDNRILLGGGRNIDFEGETTTKLENSTKITHRLNQILKDIVLPNTPFELDHQWAGIMAVGKTKKPIIKECLPEIYCGVRLGGMGVAIGSLVGKQLSELMTINKV